MGSQQCQVASFIYLDIYVALKLFIYDCFFSCRNYYYLFMTVFFLVGIITTGVHV